MKIDDIHYQKALHLATYSEGPPNEYPNEIEVWRVCEALKAADAELRQLQRDHQMLDWLEKNRDRVSIFADEDPDENVWFVKWDYRYHKFPTLREAVEFAMKQEERG